MYIYIVDSPENKKLSNIKNLLFEFLRIETMCVNKSAVLIRMRF